MLKEYILTQISTKEITFEPGGSPASFDITVVNNSEQFATFQVELLAAGAVAGRSANWYSISPDVCTKKPPGDSTTFTVQITDVPKPGFTGLIKLTVRVFSLELPSADSRQVIRLIIPGSGITPPKLDLPNPEFNRYPGESVQIPILLESFNQRPSNITLRLLGIDEAWFPDGIEQRVVLPAEEKTNICFDCQIPDMLNAPSDRYDFTIEAHQAESPVVSVQGALKILPQGYVEFNCLNTKQTIPQKPGLWEEKQPNTAQFILEFDNQSNLRQSVTIQISDIQDRRKGVGIRELGVGREGGVKEVEGVQGVEGLEGLGEVGGVNSKYSSSSTPSTSPTSSTPLLPTPYSLLPTQAELQPAQSTRFHLTINHPRPWLGWVKRKLYQAQAVTTDSRVEVNNDTQSFELKIMPLIPVGIQIAGLGITLLTGLIFGNWFLQLSQQHKDTVNTVHFNGLGGEVISGASDQTIRRWEVSGNQLVSKGILDKKADKAVRVIRYRPVNNDRVAVGFENGQIQLFNLLSNTAEPSFTASPDDRVFDLAFTKDSRSLFSGHGSGQVVQWSLDKSITKHNSILRKQQVGFAVNALALVGKADSHLAIAGRFNQLTLWDLKTDKLRQITGGGGNKDYILSMSSTDSKPNMLVTGDNQGKIKVWNLRPCLEGKDECELVSEWNGDGQAVRAVALSDDGCYLASAGEDGQAKLWKLDNRGSSANQNLAGQVVMRSQKALTSVDIIRSGDVIFVASGGEDRQVQLSRMSGMYSDCR